MIIQFQPSPSSQGWGKTKFPQLLWKAATILTYFTISTLCHLFHIHIVDYHVFSSFLCLFDLNCIHNRLQINQPKIAIPKLQFMTLALQGTSLKNIDASSILKIKHRHQQTDDYYEFIAAQWDISKIRHKASSFLKFRCLFTSTFEVHTPYIQHQRSIIHHTERKIGKLSHTNKMFHQTLNCSMEVTDLKISITVTNKMPGGLVKVLAIARLCHSW